MNWMQRHSRLIGSIALASLLLPVLATGLSTLLSIEPVYLAVLLLIIVCGILVWRNRITARSNDDER